MLRIPPGALVVTVGAAGSGKTTFLRRFPPEAIVSPDRIRFELTGDAANHSREGVVWRIAYRRIYSRLARGLTTVLDSTAADASARRAARKAARPHGAPLLLVAFDTPLEVCLERNRLRGDGLRSVPVPDEVVRTQHARVSRFLASLTPADAEQVVVLRPLEAGRLKVQVDLGPREGAEMMVSEAPGPPS